jgi:isoquinoline 1-oxidoreductase beta subunit
MNHSRPSAEWQVQQSNFNDYRALRMNEMPRVEVIDASSGNRYTPEWGGVGEPGSITSE